MPISAVDQRGTTTIERNRKQLCDRGLQSDRSDPPPQWHWFTAPRGRRKGETIHTHLHTDTHTNSDTHTNTDTHTNKQRHTQTQRHTHAHQGIIKRRCHHTNHNHYAGHFNFLLTITFYYIIIQTKKIKRFNLDRLSSSL